ncbi:hypothetical protein [Labedaea rhizosphaerae]|uniref:Uncharacterized protein n=1 Tax=Labedaea rhizosphaerae TaxID=598644 RepID=A0A4R6SKR2_LABRH|nr:hypothetical protein [Labedaea rhizosphaerae]TDQ04517.1 hypothetical protein EV186_101469 [Labedaea rhizosphaerae]
MTKPMSKDKKKVDKNKAQQDLEQRLETGIQGLDLQALLRGVSPQASGDSGSVGASAFAGVLAAESLAKAVRKTDKTTLIVERAMDAQVVDIKVGGGAFGLSAEKAAALTQEKKAQLGQMEMMIATAVGQRVMGRELDAAIQPLLKYEHVKLTTDIIKIGTDIGELKVIHNDLSKHTEAFAGFVAEVKAADNSTVVNRLLGEGSKKFSDLADSIQRFNSAMSSIQDHIAAVMTDRAAYAIHVTGKPSTFERAMSIANSLTDAGLDVASDVPDVYAKTAVTVVQSIKPWLVMLGQEIYRDIMVERMKTKEGRAAVFSKLKPLAMAKMLISNQKRLINAVLDTASPGLAYIPGWGTFIKPSVKIAVEAFLDTRLELAEKKLKEPKTKSALEKSADVLKDMADELVPISEIEKLKKSITADVLAKSTQQASYGDDLKKVSAQFIRNLDLELQAKEKLDDAIDMVTDYVDEGKFDPNDLFAILAPAIKPVITKIMTKLMAKLPFDMAAQIYTGDQLVADIDAIFMAGRNVRRVKPGEETQEQFVRPTRTAEGYAVRVIHSTALEKDGATQFIWAEVSLPPAQGADGRKGDVSYEDKVVKLTHPKWDTVRDAAVPKKIAERPERTSKGAYIRMFRNGTVRWRDKDVYHVLVHNVWGYLDPQTRVFTPVTPDQTNTVARADAWRKRTVDVTGYTEFASETDKTGRKVEGSWYLPFGAGRPFLFVPKGGSDEDIYGEWVEYRQTLKNSPRGGQGQFGLFEHLGKKVAAGSTPGYWATLYGA